MDEIILRAVRDADWPAILELAHLSLSELPNPPRQDEWLENRRSFSQPEDIQQHFVATSDERIAGYGAVERRGNDADYRLFVVVSPSDRSNLGTRLLAKLREILIGLDARRAWLLEYEADRGFLSFLEGAGFRRVENLNLHDGTPVVRLAMDAPFQRGATATWPGSARDRSLGERFTSGRMAENYLYRPPYPPELYETLLGLFERQPRILLDAGCGPGKITLGLIDKLDRADAVDPSEEMLRLARSLPNARSSKINWINSKIEDAPLVPPYGLIVAALSLHWMDLERALPKFAAALAPGAFLAVLDGDAPVDAPWENQERGFMMDFVAKVDGKHPAAWKTMRQQLEGPNIVHRLFQPAGARNTAPSMVSQSITDYLRCQHSRAAWSEDHLGEKMSGEFDSAMTSLLDRYAVNGMLQFAVQTRIEWGTLFR